MKVTKIFDAEMVSLLSGFGLYGNFTINDGRKGAPYPVIYDRISHTLQQAADFEYDYEKGVKENLVEFAKIQGFAEGLEKAAESYAKFMRTVGDTTYINTLVNAKAFAEVNKVPKVVEIKQSEVFKTAPKTPEPEPELQPKPQTESLQPSLAPHKGPLVALKTDEADGKEKAYCVFCGKMLRHKWDRACCLNHEDCDCQRYKEVKASRG